MLLPDLGVAINDGTFNMINLKNITITKLALLGCPILDRGDFVELNYPVGEYMGTFNIPLTSKQFILHMKTHKQISFMIGEVMDVETCSLGQKFRPISVSVVCY